MISKRNKTLTLSKSSEKQSNWSLIQPLSDNFLRTLNLPTVEIPDIDLIWINPAFVYVDHSYQRRVSRASLNTLKKIIENWNWADYKPPILTRLTTGEYHALDGQHTCTAAASLKIPKIPCFLFKKELTIEQRASAFVNQNTIRTNVHKLSIFKAECEQGDLQATGVLMACRKAKVSISYTTAKLKNPSTYDVSYLKKLYSKYGLETLATALSICRDAELRPILGLAVEAVILIQKTNAMTDEAIKLSLKGLTAKELRFKITKKEGSKEQRTVLVLIDRYNAAIRDANLY